MRRFGRERQSSIFDDIVCLSHPLFSWVPSPLNQHWTGITSNVKCIFHDAICEILYMEANPAFYRRSLWMHLLLQNNHAGILWMRDKGKLISGIYWSIYPSRLQKGHPWRWLLSVNSERLCVLGHEPRTRAWRVVTGIWPRRSAVHPAVRDSCSL